MATGFRYGVLRGLSAFLGLAGWIQVGLGVLVFIVGLMSGVSSSQGAGIGLLAGFLGGVLLVVSGLILVALAQALDVFIDIALNTAPIAQLIEQNAAMVAFFDTVKNKNASTPAAAAAITTNDMQPIDQGSFEDIPWRSYADGRVIAAINGQDRVFPSGAEFNEYVYSRK